MVNIVDKERKKKDLAKIRRLAKNGLNQSNIAKKMNRSVSYVNRICRAYHIETTRRSRTITQEEIDKVRALASHSIVTEIYTKSGIPKDVVKEIMIKHNIKAKGSVLGRMSELRKEVEINQNKSKENKIDKNDVFEISKDILQDKGYKSSADYISKHGYIAFQKNIKPIVDERLNSTLQTNN